MTVDVAAFAQRCFAGGFDLLAPFDATAFAAASTVGRPLPVFARPRCLGLVVGNTKHLWPIFTRAVREDARLAAEAHPLDRYVMERIGAAAAALGPAVCVIGAHETAPQPLPIQRIAEAAGLARVSPSHLSIHPEHGPWIAWRAVVLVDADHEGTPAEAPDPCRTCARPCLPALTRALEVSATERGRLDDETWRLWLGVRDACPVGRSARYDDDQIAYHYAKRRLGSKT